MRESICTADSEYKVVSSLLQFIKMVYEFLKIIRNFKQISFDGAARLIEFMKVNQILLLNDCSFITPLPAN